MLGKRKEMEDFKPNQNLEEDDNDPNKTLALQARADRA
jgi:hypothetical protein